MLALCLTLAIFLVFLFPLVISKTERDVTIKIPAKATCETVQDTLTKYYGKAFAERVRNLSHLRAAEISDHPGAYLIPAGSNPLKVMLRLTSGKQTPVRLTINGFRSLPLMVEKISAKMNFPEDSLWKLLRDSVYLQKYDLTPESAMALFVDDTYEVYWTNSARQVLDKIGKNYLLLWNQDNKEKAAELGLTPLQAMVIASITDEETNMNSEKGTIGQLYINRLNAGMKLQADPTVRYALGDFTIQRISHADLQTPSPYNTYLHKGVPPGPIRTTSHRTVQDILDALPNSYYYMCAKEDFSGGHNFASTYEEHLANAARYHLTLDNHDITR